MGIDTNIRMRIMAAMNKPIYTAVLEMLEARKGEWPQIASDTGMSYSTLCKIAQGHIESPSVHTVQRLYDFLSAPQKARAA
jgi:transcriptional regulator with XRE-family HTH domain